MKYELEEVLGKRVKVILNSGEVYIGNADDTSEPEDNQRPYKSIEIFTDDGSVDHQIWSILKFNVFLTFNMGEALQLNILSI